MSTTSIAVKFKRFSDSGAAMIVEAEDGRSIALPISEIDDPPLDPRPGESLDLEVSTWLVEKEEIG